MDFDEIKLTRAVKPYKIIEHPWQAVEVSKKETPIAGKTLTEEGGPLLFKNIGAL